MAKAKVDARGVPIPAPAKTPNPPQPPRTGTATTAPKASATAPVSPGQLRQFENANPPAAPPPAPVPTDAKGFQQYLKDRGANLGKTGPKGDGVDGVVGPKTLAEAARLGIAVPPNLAPTKPPSAPGPALGPGTGAPPQADSTSSTSAADAIPGPLPRATVDEVRARYGYLGALLDQPDIAQVIAGYDSTTDSDDQLLARLRNTPTFQNHSQNELNWLALKPADQQARIATQKTDVAAQAATLGIGIDPARLEQIAADAQRGGWSAAQVRNAVAAEFHYKPGAQSGALGAAEQTVKQTAAKYLVPLADSTLAAWDQQIAEGTATPETFEQYIRGQAKSLFPTLTAEIDKGMTVDQLADPYRQMAAQELGVNPDSVDFRDAKWMRALSTTDPATGKPTMMGLADWQRTLRSDSTYGWDRSQNGIAAGYAVGNVVAQALGLRPS